MPQDVEKRGGGGEAIAPFGPPPPPPGFASGFTFIFAGSSSYCVVTAVMSGVLLDWLAGLLVVF